MKPLVFDLFAGLGGFSEPFIEQGYRAIGFDIEAHDYGNGGYPGELVLRDIRTLTGAELVQTYGVPAVIVASPPCQNYSYFAMPWKRGKQIAAAICGQGEFPAGYKGPRTVAELNDLFYQCFRIQREVSAAAGHYVPLIIENVRGAQRWVGKARWNFGSFYLWGDVPALMPIPGKAIGLGVKAGDRNKGYSKDNPNWSHSFADQLTEGRKLPGNNGRRTDVGNGARFTSRDCGNEAVKTQADTDGGTKFHISGHAWYRQGQGAVSSKSSARKRASAEIAKIPRPLALWIARVFKPDSSKIVRGDE